MGDRVAIIRTSDRISFKRCRRKWSLSSHLRHNRTHTESASYLWLGSGCHYALEDYHGYNFYKHPAEAFRAYVAAWKKHAQQTRFQLPPDVDELTALGESLMDYYTIWLQNRDPLQTLWVDGVPQVEVKVLIELPFESPHYDKVLYQAELDRVVVIDDELWVVDYKVYNRDWTPDPDYDPQMSAYIWLEQVLYDRPVRGAILQKHFKRTPELPRIIAGGKISADKNQNTTAALYKEALEDLYGSVDRAPLANRNCYEHLLTLEGEDRDSFIQRVRTERNQNQIEAIGEQIMMELEDMLNPDLPLYKNDTKDCSWDCSFNDICIMMDSGDDWETTLLETTVNREEEDMSWRKHLPNPNLDQ